MAFFFLWYLFSFQRYPNLVPRAFSPQAMEKALGTRLEIFNSYYANLAIDDVIDSARNVVWHKINDISANNEAMLLKLGRNVAP